MDHSSSEHFSFMQRMKLLFFSLFTVGMLSLFARHMIMEEKHQSWITIWLNPVVTTNFDKMGRKTLESNKISLKHHNLFLKSLLAKPLEKRTQVSMDKYADTKNRFSEMFPRKVLIISRGRSGSSFLGNLFNENSKSLYLFEPLSFLIRASPNDTKSFFSRKILDAIYNCKMVQKVYLDFLLNNKHFRTKSRSLEPFSDRCFQRTRRGRRVCFGRFLKETCRRANSVVTKVLTHRLPAGGLWGIEELMETNKNLKIIHLIRDPRRVIASMKEAGWFDGKNFSEQVHQVCQSVWQNLEHVRKNGEFFDGRYKLVIFRDMIERPFSTVVDLYEFLEMTPVPYEVFSWILTNTRGSLKTAGDSWHAYKTYRNSTEVLNKKVEFSEKESAVIHQSYCSNVMDFVESLKREAFASQTMPEMK